MLIYALEARQTQTNAPEAFEIDRLFSMATKVRLCRADAMAVLGFSSPNHLGRGAKVRRAAPMKSPASPVIAP
jgi:hypothetical protein